MALVIRTFWSGKEGVEVAKKDSACFDDSHSGSFLHMPVYPNGITRFSLPIYLPAVLSAT